MKYVFSSAAVVAALLGIAGNADAHGPYVVLKDDGTLKGSVPLPSITLDIVEDWYAKSGAPLPDVISVWTSFDMDKNPTETLFEAASNEVTGIGLQNYYGGDGTADSPFPPVRAVLLHNNVTELDLRAKIESAPTENFADYLFLLEFGHLWGPGIHVPAIDGGAAPDELIGAPLHWSFWHDATSSPLGGNRWTDNGNGSFTIDEPAPSALTYSMLDLYLMGFADPSEVPPFGILEDAVPPSGILDPFTKGLYKADSSPWFGTATFTVTATRRVITIDDVIAANGPRAPARKDAPQSFTLGIALVVSANATDDEVATAEAALDKIAPRFAPAFNRATLGRGTIEVVTTSTPEDANDAGTGDDDDAGTPTHAASTSTNDLSCATAPSSPGGGLATLGIVAALMWIARKKRF